MSEAKVEGTKQVKIPWGPIGESVYKRTYSNRKADGSQETWPDTVVRVVDGNIGLVDPKFIEPDEREKLIQMLLKMEIIPAGRHLSASGIPGRQFVMNCHASGYDPKDPAAHFSFLFDELLQGGGVGANYSNRYIHKIPLVNNRVDFHIACDISHPDYHEFEHLVTKHNGFNGALHVTIQDSREGWVEAAELLIGTFFNTDQMEPKERILIFDFSQIRPRGGLMKTSRNGVASGPAPLIKALVDIAKHLNGAHGRQLTSLDVMTIDHTLAACVVVGGKRRSSRMSVKSWRDPDIFEFINCKREDGAHWTTNISVEIDNEFVSSYQRGNAHTKAVARAVVLGKRLNGEPGFWNRSLSQVGEKEPEKMYCPNPCGEIGLHEWESCNLGHVNMEPFGRRPSKDLLEAFRLMSRWLVRATFSDIPQQRQRKVVDENRRIGVGFLGFHAWLALRGMKYSTCWENSEVRMLLRKCRSYVTEEAISYSNAQGIPVPVKNTALAPTGTTALLYGTTSSGQAMMYPYFKRLVRYSNMDPELAVIKSEGHEVFIDEDAADTSIAVFWCEDPLVAKVRAAGWDPNEVLESQFEIPFETSLKVQEMLQTEYADNAVSFTINLLPSQLPSEEGMELLLLKHLPNIKGTTVFVEKTRKNAPIQPITKSEFELFSGPKEVTQVEVECLNGICPIK
jgi:ribonucleoside-triphosphate reductase